MTQVWREKASQTQAFSARPAQPLVTVERQDSTVVRNMGSAARLPGFYHPLAGSLGQVIDHLCLSFCLCEMQMLIALAFSDVSRRVE